jgi:hypothetical protein
MIPFGGCLPLTCAQDTATRELCFDYPGGHTGLLSTWHTMLTSSNPSHYPVHLFRKSPGETASSLPCWFLRSSPSDMSSCTLLSWLRPRSMRHQTFERRSTKVLVKILQEFLGCENTMLWLTASCNPQKGALAVRHSSSTRLGMLVGDALALMPMRSPGELEYKWP